MYMAVQVCIVQKRDHSGNMYAMKYVRKGECAERGALKNIAREAEMLSRLEHPCLVNLWFSFQDEEDLFMVSDLLLGGDLRYHLQQDVQFNEESVTLFIAEIALALDYLQKNRIIHRDIKPDNILLDEEGHAHVTDFNIAVTLEGDQLATSMSGTKPYMAPEIYKCSFEDYGVLGYGFAVDWWSLGILAWETLAGMRPFSVHTSTSQRDALSLLTERLESPVHWSRSLCELINKLLTIEPLERCSTLKELKQLGLMMKLDFDAILHKQIKPIFIPPKDHLNCDPTFELEEMIIEAKPLHKKKKRLAKQRSLKAESRTDELIQSTAHATGGENQHEVAFIPEYRVYNREHELERERKERQWEEELSTAMSQAEKQLPEQRFSICFHRKNQPKKQHENQVQWQLQLPFGATSLQSGDTDEGNGSGHLSVNTSTVKARISGSPLVSRSKSIVGALDMDFIDASPEPSTS